MQKLQGATILSLRMDLPMPGLEKTSLSASPWLRLSRAPGIPSLQDLHKLVRPILVILPALGLLLGFGVRVVGSGQWSGTIWAAATVPVLGALLIEIVASLRRGDVGLDIVAALSMTGALVFGEHLAAVVVALMYAGGQYLESFAERRANREMTALLARVPRTALRYRDGRLEEVPLDAVAPEDRLLVRQGDVVPVDGVVAEGLAVLDQSALTGESVPVQKRAGEPVMSGVTNVGDAFDLSATHRAAESTYAGIVRLIEAAQRSKAPMARLADRFAMAFLALTVVLAGGAWLWSGDPIRALAVLVVATPCPLILAVPVAIVSGVSRAAKAGVLVKGGRALETLARVKALVIDKTGTLTHGQARIVEIRPVAGLSPEGSSSLQRRSTRHRSTSSRVPSSRRRRPGGSISCLPRKSRRSRARGWKGSSMAGAWSWAGSGSSRSVFRRPLGRSPTAIIPWGRSWWPWRSMANPPGS